MTSIIHCLHCNHPIAYSDDERGAETYCEVCNHACLIPAAEESGTEANSSQHASQEVSSVSVDAQVPRLAPKSAPSIFSAHGLADVEQKVIEQIRCLCGAENPVQVSDYGSTIYCRSCGAEISVGKDWRVAAATTVASGAENTDEDAPPPLQTRVRWFGSRIVWGSGLVMVVGMGTLLYFTQHSWTPALVELGVFPKPKPRPVRIGTEADVPVEKFDPAALTLAMIEGLRDHEEPFQALIQAFAWRNALRAASIAATDSRLQRLDVLPQEILTLRRQAMLELVLGLASSTNPAEAMRQGYIWNRLFLELKLPVEDALRRELQRVSRELLEQVEPITLQMIDALNSRLDATEALTQAELFRQELLERGAPAEDPRFARLREVVAQIENRLATPDLVTPELVTRFKAAVQAVADALQNRNITEARSSVTAAEKLLHESPELLAPHAVRLQSLKGRLRALEIRELGADQVRAHFQTAEKLAADAESLTRSDSAAAARQVSQAMYEFAKARMRLFQAPKWKPAEEDEFEKTFDSLRPKLQYAQGWRAVENAKRGNAAQDPGARKRQADRAFALLQGLPESQIRPWLDQVRKWHEEKDKPTINSKVGHEIELRDRYDACLEYFASADLDHLVPECLELRRQVDVAKLNPESFHRLIGDLVFEVIESRLAQLLSSRGTVPEAEYTREMQSISSMASKLVPWQQDPRGKAVLAMLREQNGPVAEEQLKKARQLAEANQLEEAISLAELLAATAPVQIADQASALRDAWKKEFLSRADRAAREKDWEEIQKLVSRPGHAETLRRLDLHLQRWPASEHAAEANRARNKLVETIRSQFDREYQRVQRAYSIRDWSTVATTLPLLLSFVQDPTQRESLQKIQNELKLQEITVRKKWQDLQKRKNLTREEDVVQVLEIATLFLVFVPNDIEARQAIEDARKRAAELAPSLLKSAKFRIASGLDRNSIRKKLATAYLLDPTGPVGREARELLNEFSE